MTDTIQEQKWHMRKHMSQVLKSISSQEKLAAGLKVAQDHIAPFLDTHGITTGFNVALFANLSDEINTVPLEAVLSARGIRRYVPVATSGQTLSFIELSPETSVASLKKGPYQFPAPPFDSARLAQAQNFFLIFVPGLAFSLSGQRLGRGKGFYDRWLSTIPKNETGIPQVIGLALDQQIQTAIPMTALDRTVDAICTPGRGLVQVWKNTHEFNTL